MVCGRDACATGMDVFNVAVGICWNGWVRLGGHDPSERREGRMDVDMDADELVLMLFAHV